MKYIKERFLSLENKLWLTYSKNGYNLYFFQLCLPVSTLSEICFSNIKYLLIQEYLNVLGQAEFGLDLNVMKYMQDIS